MIITDVRYKSCNKLPAQRLSVFMQLAGRSSRQGKFKKIILNGLKNEKSSTFSELCNFVTFQNVNNAHLYWKKSFIFLGRGPLQLFSVAMLSNTVQIALHFYKLYSEITCQICANHPLSIFVTDWLREIHGKVVQIVQIYASLCKLCNVMHHCANLFTFVKSFAYLCKFVQSCENLCKGLQSNS